MTPDEMIAKMIEDYRNREPQPQVILMSRSEWREFSAACRKAGVKPEGRYWDWRMRTGVFAP